MNKNTPEEKLFIALKNLAILCEINQWGGGSDELHRAWTTLNDVQDARKDQEEN